MSYQNRWIICGCSIPTLSLYTWTHSQFLLLRCVSNSMCRRPKTVLVYTAEPCWYTRPMLALSSAACLRCLCAVSASQPYTRLIVQIGTDSVCSRTECAVASVLTQAVCVICTACVTSCGGGFPFFGELLLFPLYGLFFTQFQPSSFHI